MSGALRKKGALTIQQTKSLIENVKSFPCIWNPDDEEYVHRSTIANAWAEISKKIQLPEDLLRAKWKNLRDLFKREMKRTKVTAVDDYHGRWKHFKKLWFLYRLDGNHISEDGSETNEFEPTLETYVKIEPPDEASDFIFLDTDQETNGIAEKQNSNSDRVCNINPTKRKRINEVYTNEDCDMMFLMSLAPYLKLLKPLSRLVVRNRIQEMILKEIEQSVNEQF